MEIDLAEDLFQTSLSVFLWSALPWPFADTLLREYQAI